MNTKIRLRSAIAILLSALLILSIAGCSKKSPKKEEKKPPKPKKSLSSKRRIGKLRIARIRPSSSRMLRR